MKEVTEDRFEGIKPLITAQFDALKGGKLFNVVYDRDEIVNVYLNAFATPELRQDHNCSACKSFIRQVGGMVALGANGARMTLWDLNMDKVPNILRDSVKALADFVKSKPVDGLFFHDMPSAGVDKNLDKETGIIWEHFYLKIPKCYVNDKNNTLGKASAELRETKNVLMRGLETITDDAVDSVLELIAQSSLYRGNEHEASVKKFQSIKAAFKRTPAKPAEKRDAFCWMTAGTESAAVCRIRNTSIGTLLVDISEGTDLDAAVRKFEAMVAPANYKRPTALVTPRMVEAAKTRLTELGLISALSRRRLDSRDLTAAHALFVYRPEKATKDIFDLAMADQPIDTKTLSKVEKVSIGDFLEKVLPTAKSVKVLVEREHFGNFVTLTGATESDAANLMKWGNSYAWSYSGGVADSIKEKVKLAGGKVDGWMRVSLGWHNGDDLDLHMQCPTAYAGTEHVYFGHKQGSQAWLDVDMNVGFNINSVDPVENITCNKQLTPGSYTVYVSQYNRRSSADQGYDVEIEVNGDKHTFGATKNNENIQITFTVQQDGTVVFPHSKATKTSCNSVVKWGVKTGQFRKVNAITLSPNHWDKPVGNKHWFFLLEGCMSDEATRPFYNEFLTEELAKDRKTTEVLAGKIQVEPAAGVELSGLGFSETLRNRIYAEVEGKFKRTIEIVF